MEEVELMAMITWPDCSLSEDSLQLDCDAYASCTDTHEISLDLQIADRKFEDSAMSLGLLLDKLLTEDPMGSSMELENMDSCAISSSCVDLQHESSSFPACALNDRAGGSDADALTWGSLEMDMNLIADMSNVFHGKSDDQELVKANSVGSPADMAIEAISSHSVSIGKLASGRAVDWKKTIVKKSVLEKAVERLGGGKNGALKLWKLIQVWLKHQNHPQINGMSRSAITDHGDLLCSTSTSNADVSFQNKSTSSSKSPNNPKMDLASLTESHLQGISGLKTSCIASTTLVSDDKSCDDHGLNTPASLLPKFDYVTNKPSSAASSRAARKNKMARQRRLIAHGHHHSHQRRTFCSPYRPSHVHARGAYSNSFKCHPTF